MEKRVYKNNTKVTQVIYDSKMTAVTVKPEETFVEDLSNEIDTNALVKREKEIRALKDDVQETRRVKKALALIRVAKTVEDLDKLLEGEQNPEVCEAALTKQKEILNAKSE